MIHRSPLPGVDIPDEALTTYALHRSGELGDKPALIDGPTGRVLTYAALEGAVRSFAGGLVARGFAKGEVLALMAPNLPEYAVVFHGVALAGGVITTVNPTYTDREVHHQLLDSGATILVTVPPFLETALKATEGTSVAGVYVLGAQPGQGLPAGARPFPELLGAPLAEQVPVLPDDVIAL